MKQEDTAEKGKPHYKIHPTCSSDPGHNKNWTTGAKRRMRAIYRIGGENSAGGGGLRPADCEVGVSTARADDGGNRRAPELSPAADVDKLCSLAMNTYLTMLLDTGTLHCDPHPGNLLRTPDGRLCILDWGLVSEIRPDIQIYLIEHVAHLTSQDYRKVPADLVALGFVPEGKEAAIQDTDAVEVLTSVYAQFAGGGGAAKIDVGLVINELTGLSEKYGNLFQLPPYFAYIARAFGVLEGIGLSNNPNYAIVGECLPYVSQRLLTDPSPRVGGALNSFVFGEEAMQSDDRVLDAERLELILSGFGSYSQSVASTKNIRKESALQSLRQPQPPVLLLLVLLLFLSPLSLPRRH